MNNVFKKRFRRKLGLSELLVECEKVTVSLRANELDADFKSRRKNLVTYIPILPMLNIVAESYTRRIYSEFEKKFKKQFKLMHAPEIQKTRATLISRQATSLALKCSPSKQLLDKLQKIFILFLTLFVN